KDPPKRRQPVKATASRGLAEAFRENTLTQVRTRRTPPRQRHLAQSRHNAHLASDHSPTNSVLRANPYPKVTDQFCRLPLPTFFYRPEAVNLGDLLRIWVRPSTKITLTHSDFQGPTR